MSNEQTEETEFEEEEATVSPEEAEEHEGGDDDDDDDDDDDGEEFDDQEGSEPKFNEEIPHAVLMLYKTALTFTERMALGQRQLAMRESLPALKTAIKEAKPFLVT